MTKKINIIDKINRYGFLFHTMRKKQSAHNIIIAAIIILPALVSSCAVPVKKDYPVPVKFIIMGNTSPASPFSGYAERLDHVIGEINEQNPAFVAHTGNMVQGGSSEMGIRESDVARQYRKYLTQIDKLQRNLCPLPGERDLYNGSLDLYRRYIGKKPCYSFNYGNIHFIVFNTMKEGYMSVDQRLRWLRRDLHRHRKFPAMFVFTNNPVFPPYSSMDSFEKAEELHAVLSQYPVKAVFSGQYTRLYKNKKDGIEYIVTGCGGYNREEGYGSEFQYYIVEHADDTVSYRGVRVRFPQWLYQPKIFIPK